MKLVRSFSILFLFFMFSSKLSPDLLAQQLICDVPFEGIPIEVQAFSVGDSLFVAFEEKTGVNVQATPRYYWIDPSGKISLFKVRLPDELFSAVTRIDTINYFYFMDGGKNNQELGISYAGTNMSKGPPEKANIKLTGRIMGLYADRNLYVFTFQKKERTLRLTEIRGKTVISERDMKLSIDLTDFPAREITFIPRESFLQIESFTPKVKIFKDGDVVTVVVDEPNEETGDAKWSFAAKTTIYRFEMTTGKSMIYLVSESSKEQFRTFLYEDRLFRMIDRYKDQELKVGCVTLTVSSNITFGKVVFMV